MSRPSPEKRHYDAAPGMPRKNDPKNGCRCKGASKRGGFKQQYKTQAAALDVALAKLGRTGTATTYPCPTAPGVWHVATHTR